MIVTAGTSGPSSRPYSPIGRGSGLKIRTVSVRVRLGAPESIWSQIRFGRLDGGCVKFVADVHRVSPSLRLCGFAASGLEVPKQVRECWPPAEGMAGVSTGRIRSGAALDNKCTICAGTGRRSSKRVAELSHSKFRRRRFGRDCAHRRRRERFSAQRIVKRCL